MAAQSQDNGLDPTVLLLQEIQSITSAMRRNQRWANTGSSSSYTSGSANARLFAGQGKREGGEEDEGDLMLGFVDLRRAIYDANGQYRQNQQLTS
jgi:brefeldin A-resistance guanine nucleotide exchange factor 1